MRRNRTNSDGGTLFSEPYKPKVKVSLALQYELKEVASLLRQVRNSKDADELRRVLSVGVLRLDDEQARQVCDLLLNQLGEVVKL